MYKIVISIIVTSAIIILAALALFNLYADFALDYSLENLKQALAATREGDVSDVGNRLFRSNLESLAFEELSRRDANLETVLLLENASRAIREAVDEFGFSRAGIYLSEVIKGKVPQRNPLLRMADSVYYFSKGAGESLQNLWKYVSNRFRPAAQPPQLEETGALILAEAERMESSWKLEEAERYYREFLDRFSSRPERGFVKISLAHILVKMRRLKDAAEILRAVQREFPGTKEEALAAEMFERMDAVEKRLARLPELENWIKARPERLFLEEGGLELALSYLATYQLDRAHSVLEKLSEAEDPRLRSKALFYRGWIYKWQGELDKGKELFQTLKKEPRVEEALEIATTTELAAVHVAKKEYGEALKQYEELSRKAVKETWAALSELEQTKIYAIELGDAEAARRSLQRLESVLSPTTAGIETVRKRLQEFIERGARYEAFRALEQGRVEVAFRIFHNYLKKFPRDGLAHSGLASIHILKAQMEKALEEAEEGFRLTRHEYTATVLGFVYEKMDNLPEAGKYYEIGTRLKATYLPAQFNLAWVYVMTDRFEEADKLLAILEGKTFSGMTQTTRAKILNNRGCALWGLGKKGEAIAYFREALEVLPGLTEAKKNLNLAGTGDQPAPAVI